MPRAIIAIRNYPIAVLLAVVLFAASLILAAGSLGNIGGGDDDGSGLGGTGRNGDFGGSGMGGTGSPSPFLGVSTDTGESTESDRHPDPAAPAIVDPEALDRAMRRIDTASPPGMLQIHEPLQTADLVDTERRLDAIRQTREALRDSANRREDLALQDRTDVINIRIELDDPVDDTSLTQQIQPYTLPAGMNRVEVADGTDDTSAEAEQTSAQDGTGDPRGSGRIQRPELPPFQRVRPVERASIAAPPPRPMRI